MRKVSAGNDDLVFASTNNFCASFSTTPVVGPGEEAFRDHEGPLSPAAVTAALETNSAMWNKKSYGGIAIGMAGRATVDSTIAEGGLMGISNPSQRQLQAFQSGTDYLMPNNIPALQSHGEMNSVQSNTSHAGSSGAGERPSSDQPGGGPGFLCHACGISKKCRPTVCCRKCQKLYHPMCAGYEPSRRKYPPPDWICPMCPGGQQGPKEKYVHPSLRGKGIVTAGSQPWCPVCFGDNRVPGRKKSLDGGQKCVGCGLKAHAECQRLRPDGTWPCVECHRRMQNMASGISHTARLGESVSSTTMDRGWQGATVVSSVDEDGNDKDSPAPVVPPSSSTRPDLGHRMETKSRVLGAAPTWSGTSAGAIETNVGSSMESKSETVACAGALGDCKPVPHAVNSLGCFNPQVSRAVESQQTLLQRKGGVNSTAVDHRRTTVTPGAQEPVDAFSWSGESRSFSKQTPGAEKTSRRGTSSVVDAVGSSRRSDSVRENLAGASVMIRKTFKKKGKLRSGKTCAGCKQWWNATADCLPSGRGKSDPTNLGKWIGGWRCQGCLDRWENGLKLRTTRVVEAWANHEKMRKEKEKDFQAMKDAAIAASLREKRHGFLMSTVEVPPIQHPPAGILPFLDEKFIRDTGFRLARITRDDCAFLGPEGVLAKVDICWEHRIFAVIEGVFDPQKQRLMDFLAERKGLPCRISGKAAAGESSSTMGDYRARLLDLRDGMDKPPKDSPGTFFLDTASGQSNVLNWLPLDPLMASWMPESPRGGLEAHIAGDRCKFGPFTFGGGRNFPLESLGLGGRQSHRQYMKGKGRDRIGGSTTHIDGMGSFTAIGGLKDGVKMVTAFETADCATALAVAKFKAFAKPGGSAYVVNDRIDDDPTLRRRLSAAGVRYATFPIRAGDAYLVPSGALHEFMNEVPCLSVAWNILPHPGNCLVALNMAEASAREAEEALGVNTDRSKSAIEHAPPDSMRQRHAAFVIKRWLDKGPLRLRLRRALIAGGGGGATEGTSTVMGGVNELCPRKAVVRWAELAARHEIPSSIRKKYVCYWPNGDFYKESPPVFKKIEAVRESVEKVVFNEASPDHAEGGSGTKSEKVPECMQQNEQDLPSIPTPTRNHGSPPASAPAPVSLPKAGILSQSHPPAPILPKAQTLSSSVLPTDPWRMTSSPYSYGTPSLPTLHPPLQSPFTWLQPTSYSWLPAPPTAPMDQSDIASADEVDIIDVGIDGAGGDGSERLSSEYMMRQGESGDSQNGKVHPVESSPEYAECGHGDPVEVGEPQDWGVLSSLIEVDPSPGDSSPENTGNSPGEPAEERDEPQDVESLSPLVEIEASPKESSPGGAESGRGELHGGRSPSIVKVETSTKSLSEGALLEGADNNHSERAGKEGEPKDGGSRPPTPDLETSLEEPTDEVADKPSKVLESSPTADLSEGSSVTAGAVTNCVVSGSVEASDAPSSESQIRSQSSSGDESAVCGQPGVGSLCVENASSSGEEGRGRAVGVSGCKDVSPMPLPPKPMAQPEVEKRRRESMVARDDDCARRRRGVRDRDETGDGCGKLAEVVSKKPSVASNVDKPRPRYIYHSRSCSSSSRSSISYRSSSRSSSSSSYRSRSYDSGRGRTLSEVRQDARQTSEGRDRVHRASLRSSRRQCSSDNHDFDGGDRRAEEKARYRGDHGLPRDRVYRRSVCRSGSRGEAYWDRGGGRRRREREDIWEKRDRDRERERERERERYRYKGGTKEQEWCRSRRSRRESSYLPPRDRRGEIRGPPEKQRSRLPWREETSGRSKVLAGDNSQYPRGQIRDRERDKVDSYSSWWKRSRSREDRGRIAAAWQDGRRRESSSVLNSSRDCRVAGPPDNAKTQSTSALAPPSSPTVGHALMPPARGTLAWNPGDDTGERTGRGRLLARAEAVSEKKKRRRENRRESSVKGQQGIRDGACAVANGPSGSVTAAASGSDKGGDRASAVSHGGDRRLNDDRNPVASKSTAEASSFWNSRAAAAAAAEGTARSRPLSGVDVLVDRLRVGGGGFADVFTNPATLNSRASSGGSVVPSSAQKEQMVVEGHRQGFIDAQSLDRKRSVTAKRFSKSEGWGHSRESRVGGPERGEKVNGLSASNVSPDRTCVSRKRHNSVIDAKDCYDGGCSVSMESGELSEATESGERKDPNKRRRKECDN